MACQNLIGSSHCTFVITTFHKSFVKSASQILLSCFCWIH